jgi:hypothetical protein
MNISIVIAQEEHLSTPKLFAILESSVLLRGTGIAKKNSWLYPEKIENKDAIILTIFCYIESWQDSNYVAHSGLIVHPDYRNLGLAKIKSKVFDYFKKISKC